MLEKVTIEQANSIMQEAIKPLKEVEEIVLEKAVNRVLAKEQRALHDQPPFPRSPVDGYACIAQDTSGASKGKPTILQVVGEIQAGQEFTGEIQTGQALRIMTGAPIPASCDCCIRQESTDYGKDSVQIYEEMSSYQNYCYAGEDYKIGQTLIDKNTRIGYIELGILASNGASKVEVYRQPRIALLTTGDEIMSPSETLGAGKVYNSNQYLLLGRLQELGITPTFIQHLSDNEQEVAKLLHSIKNSVDIIITTGGVSVGKKDIFHIALEIARAKKMFWKVQVKPGSPTIFSILEKTPIVSLSGNPFGSLVNFELLIRPMLYKLTNNDKYQLVVEQVVLANDFLKESKGRRVIRARCENNQVFLPQKHASGILSSAIDCNCLVDIPAGNKGLRKGDNVTIWKL